QYLKNIISVRDVLVWGRGNEQVNRYKTAMEAHGFHIETTRDTSEILRTCNLIVTTTPALKPLLQARDLQPGTHITAVGSDTPQKQELDEAILAQADAVVVDSIAQCLERGETRHAIKAGQIHKNTLIELGNVIQGKTKARTADSQITVADLTGVAVNRYDKNKSSWSHDCIAACVMSDSTP
ncbi:MAG: ornithine cyclodeaminase family protein, partial [Anaerolineae bacterium]